MLRKFVSVIVLSLALMSSFAFGQAAEKGNWDLTLNGSGASDNDFDSNSLGATVGIGYFTTKEVEFGLRQTVNWSDSEGSDSVVNGATVGFAQYHFDLQRWQPFVGVSVGYQYGDCVQDEWIGGPEAGVKYFVNDTTYIYGIVQYEVPLEDGFDDGAFVYGLGVGFRF